MIWFGKKKEVETPIAEPPKAAPAPVPESVPDPFTSAQPQAPVEAPVPAAPAPVPAPVEAPVEPPAETPVEVPAAPAPAKPNRKALYNGLMNALYDAVLVLDDNGHIMDCNQRVEDVFGYSRDDTWDMPLTELVPGINARIFAQMKAGLKGNHRVLINARCHRKDGTSFPGEVGVGIMEMMGESLVFSIRNIEKRGPVKAIIRPAAAKPVAEPA